MLTISRELEWCSLSLYLVSEKRWPGRYTLNFDYFQAVVASLQGILILEADLENLRWRKDLQLESWTNGNIRRQVPRLKPEATHEPYILFVH